MLRRRKSVEDLHSLARNLRYRSLRLLLDQSLGRITTVPYTVLSSSFILRFLEFSWLHQITLCTSKATSVAPSRFSSLCERALAAVSLSSRPFWLSVTYLVSYSISYSLPSRPLRTARDRDSQRSYKERISYCSSAVYYVRRLNFAAMTSAAARAMPQTALRCSCE